MPWAPTLDMKIQFGSKIVCHLAEDKSRIRNQWQKKVMEGAIFSQGVCVGKIIVNTQTPVKEQNAEMPTPIPLHTYSQPHTHLYLSGHAREDQPRLGFEILAIKTYK